MRDNNIIPNNTCLEDPALHLEDLCAGAYTLNILAHIFNMIPDKKI
jgi:hypothetical protein